MDTDLTSLAMRGEQDSIVEENLPLLIGFTTPTDSARIEWLREAKVGMSQPEKATGDINVVFVEGNLRIIATSNNLLTAIDGAMMCWKARRDPLYTFTSDEEMVRHIESLFPSLTEAQVAHLVAAYQVMLSCRGAVHSNLALVSHTYPFKLDKSRSPFHGMFDNRPIQFH